MLLTLKYLLATKIRSLAQSLNSLTLSFLYSPMNKIRKLMLREH